MAELRGFLVAILLFSLVLTGCFVFMSGVYSFYGVSPSDEFSGFYAYVNKSVVDTTTSYQIENVTSSMESANGQTGQGTAMGAGLFSAILMPFQAVSTAVTMLGYIGSLTGIPGWMISIFGTIVIIMVMFWIMSAIRGKDI